MADYLPPMRRPGAARMPSSASRTAQRMPARGPWSDDARSQATGDLQRSLADSPRVAHLARTAVVLQRRRQAGLPVRVVQRLADEEEVLQGRFASAVAMQRTAVEDEEPVQRAAREEEEDVTQRRAVDDEEMVQGRFDQTPDAPNRTGMPDALKANIETLAGMDLSDVRVHTNSATPASLNARAYASGNEIHLGPGQEQHLPHEAWHVVQQRQGRVAPNLQVGSVPVNDDTRLEAEADLMGARAVQRAIGQVTQRRRTDRSGRPVVQLKDWYAYGAANTTPHIHCYNSGCHLKDAYGNRYDLVKQNYRNDQSVIDQAFDAIRAQYPRADNPVRVAVLAEMRSILRDTKARPA